MNASGQIRSAGFSAQLATDGEPLTYLSGTVNAIVHRNVVKGKDFFASLRDVPVDFSLLGLTEIEVLMSDVPTAPTAGQAFVDGLGIRHRVRMVSNTDITWQAYCSPSPNS